MAEKIRKPGIKNNATPVAEPETPATVETVPADPTPMELMVLENSVAFRWNFDEIKTRLAAETEKYKSMVVTEKNLPEMEKTCREIASLRVKVDGFRVQTKKQLSEPANKFDSEVKELLEIIRQSETPLRDQISKYETARVSKLIADLAALAKATGEAMGLRPEYRYEVPAKLAQRSVSEKQARTEVVTAIEALVQQQAKDDAAKAEADRAQAERAEAIRQTSAMLAVTCQSMSELAGLKTPISAGEVMAKIAPDASPTEITQAIMAEVNRRKAIEQAAAAPPPPPPVVQYGPPAAPAVDMASGPDQSVVYAVGPATRYNVDLRLEGVTVAQAAAMLEKMSELGVRYSVISQNVVPGNG